MKIINILKKSGITLLILVISIISTPSILPVKTYTDEISSEANAIATQYQMVWDYYSNACFIGDSLMVGFRNYSKRNDIACARNSEFLAATSFASYYALKPEKTLKRQPEYIGHKMAVWDSISLMKADKVFICLGTNDLVGISPEKTSDNLITLCNTIKAANPNVSIHIIGMAPVYIGVNKGHLNINDITIYNTLCREKAAVLGYGFIDLNPYLSDSLGNLKPEYCSDKYVHMNNKAYGVWNQVLFDYAINQITAQLQMS